MTDDRTALHRLLTAVPAVYETLGEALVPGGGGLAADDMPRAPKDPLQRPAPANLDVTDHRHELVRGLRWWVDAVRERGEHTRVGHSVTLMCAWLLGNLGAMAPEDHTELADNLRTWLGKAGGYQHLGAGEDMDVWSYLSERSLPAGAEHQRMRVADAAKVLGCTVRTIQRRVPAEAREGGLVRLGDAIPRCTHCDLIVGQCEHTRPRALSR